MRRLILPMLLLAAVVTQSRAQDAAQPQQPSAPQQPAAEAAPAQPAQPAVPQQPAAEPAPNPAPAPAQPAEAPRPGIYPKSWELKFEHSMPKRVEINIGNGNRAYWYMTYTVTNESDREQLFLPMFELLTEDGRLSRNDRNIPKSVFEAIKQREGARFLQPAALIGGELRLGPDEAKDGVAIWPEPTPEMGSFSIFATGLSGETATVPGPDGKPVILRKTLQLNYLIRGDDVHPGEDEINENPEEWVMR
jgi:hypothetical protein